MGAEKVLSMPIADFFGYLAAIRKNEKEEFNSQMKISAFTGWQQYTLLAGMFGGKDIKIKSFIEYSEQLGLLSEAEKQYLKMYKELEKQMDKNRAKVNIEKANNIIQMDRRNRQKKAERG